MLSSDKYLYPEVYRCANFSMIFRTFADVELKNKTVYS